MKKYFIALSSILLFGSICNAQINGITDKGEKVFLYENGTWKYENDSLNENSPNNVIPYENNEYSYTKSKNATFLVKSDKTKSGVWIDPKKWSFKKSKPTSASEYKFYSIKGDLYGMLIAEKISLPLESLVNIAISNAKEAATNVEIVKKEYRIVNGLKVAMMQMTGKIQGIVFIYFGYYYTGERGSFQMLTYTSQNLFEQNKNEMEELLNGFVEL